MLGPRILIGAQGVLRRAVLGQTGWPEAGKYERAKSFSADAAEHEKKGGMEERGSQQVSK